MMQRKHFDVVKRDLLILEAGLHKLVKDIGHLRLSLGELAVEATLARKEKVMWGDQPHLALRGERTDDVQGQE